MSKEINWPMFERALEAIKANPGHWEQSTWHCGTSHCFAGFCHILDLTDRCIVKTPLTEVAHTGRGADWILFGEDTEHVSIATLGLSRRQAEWLFSFERTIQDFQECLDRHDVAIYGDGEIVWPDSDGS